MGGRGSGSVKGKNATHYIDGRWANMERLRKKAKPGQVVGHKEAVTRDSKSRNIVGPPTKKNESKNLRLISKSQNTREAMRSRRNNRRAAYR